MNKLTILAAALALTSVAAPAFAQQSPNYPPKERERVPHATSNFDCSTPFGHMKRVYKEEVAGIDNRYNVWVTPVCMGDELMRSDGNAAYLRPTIADNEVLVDALFEKSFGPDDVFAVKMMGDDTINLYVHDFRY